VARRPADLLRRVDQHSILRTGKGPTGSEQRQIKTARAHSASTARRIIFGVDRLDYTKGIPDR
jgi:trehalose-6-phosphate synthase